MNTASAIDINRPGDWHAQSSRFDPPHEVDLEDPAAVGKAIRSILDRLYGRGYDTALLGEAMQDAIDAYRGDFPGLLRCDTLYHDLRHALETGLTTARLLDGYAKSAAAGSLEPIDGDHALLAVLLALFHDIGLLRRSTEPHLWGPVLIPIHEERGVEFMQRYLSRTALAALADKSQLIMSTKLVFNMPATWSAADRRLAAIVATADLLSQFSDRCYLEKCRDFLFVEFSAVGIAGSAASPYPDRETLLAKTPEFFSGVCRQRLDDEYQGVSRLLELHTGNGNPWEEAIQRHLGFLDVVLRDHELSRLRRHPRPFI